MFCKGHHFYLNANNCTPQELLFANAFPPITCSCNLQKVANTQVLPSVEGTVVALCRGHCGYPPSFGCFRAKRWFEGFSAFFNYNSFELLLALYESFNSANTLFWKKNSNFNWVLCFYIFFFEISVDAFRLLLLYMHNLSSFKRFKKICLGQFGCRSKSPVHAFYLWKFGRYFDRSISVLKEPVMYNEVSFLPGFDSRVCSYRLKSTVNIVCCPLASTCWFSVRCILK